MPPPTTHKCLIFKSFLLSAFVTTSLLAAGSVLAFGGGGGSSSSSQRYQTGVDSFGTHFGGEGQVQIQFNCVPDEQATSDYGLCTCLTENAEFDYTSGKCACKTGWIQKGASCELVCPEIENCAEYDADCECVKCGTTSILNADGKCKACPKGYVSNQEGTKCDQCADGYFMLLNNQCVSCLEDNIAFLVDWGGDYTPEVTKESCLTCDNRTVIDIYPYTGGRYDYCVIKNCPTNSFRAADGLCYSCDKTEGGTIPPADPVASTCGDCSNLEPRISSTGLICYQKCSTGTVLDANSNSCVPCNYEGSFSTITEEECTACTNPAREIDNNQCVLVCKSDEVRYNGQCCPKVENCTEYDWNCKCSRCTQNFYLKDNVCESCGEGYKVVNGACVACGTADINQKCGCAGDKVWNGNGKCDLPVENCIEYNENWECISCDTEYLLYEGVCKKCSAPSVCMSCALNEAGKAVYSFLPSGTQCTAAGVAGTCNTTGQCEPTIDETVTECALGGSCGEGQFCNYGGTYTPQVCQKVTYETAKINGKTYFYNTLEDLKAWCRPADGGKNCIWGYLAAPGAIDWCKSLGIPMIKKADFEANLSALKEILPKANQSTAYWYDAGFGGRAGAVRFTDMFWNDNGRQDGYHDGAGVICTCPDGQDVNLETMTCEQII